MIYWDLVLQYLQENIKTLIVHLIEKYSSKLESIDYVDTFRALKLKYEQVSICRKACGIGFLYFFIFVNFMYIF